MMAQNQYDTMPQYDEARVRRAYALLDVEGKGLVSANPHHLSPRRIYRVSLTVHVSSASMYY